MIAIGPLIGTAARILTAVGTGYSAYQAYEAARGSSPPPNAAMSSRAIVPMTPSEISRRNVARQMYSGGAVRTFQPSERRHRRMNVLNPRALRRSIRRVRGFSHFAARVGHYTHPGTRYRLKGFRGRRKSHHARS